MANRIDTTSSAFTEHLARGRGSVHVRDFAGHGPAFVLLHGFPDNSHIYDDLIPHFASAGRRIVTIDFLGFGDIRQARRFALQLRATARRSGGRRRGFIARRDHSRGP